MTEVNTILKIDVKQKKFDSKTIFSNLELSINSGEIISIFGPSGCGKTTLVRMIAGLEQTSEGDVVLSGDYQNNIGFIFQKPVLYPHLNVGKNILLGCKARLDKHERLATVANSLELVNLPKFANRKVTTSSPNKEMMMTVPMRLETMTIVRWYLWQSIVCLLSVIVMTCVIMITMTTPIVQTQTATKRQTVMEFNFPA